MNPVDLDQASGILLGIAGGLLQFGMRQFKGVSDIWYHLVAVALTGGCFWLIVRDWPRTDARDSAIVLVLWISGHLTSVWGGTFITSVGAHVVSDNARDGGVSAAKNLLLPVSDSK